MSKYYVREEMAGYVVEVGFATCAELRQYMADAEIGKSRRAEKSAGVEGASRVVFAEKSVESWCWSQEESGKDMVKVSGCVTGRIGDRVLFSPDGSAAEFVLSVSEVWPEAARERVVEMFPAAAGVTLESADVFRDACVCKQMPCVCQTTPQ